MFNLKKSNNVVCSADTAIGLIGNLDNLSSTVQLTAQSEESLLPTYRFLLFFLRFISVQPMRLQHQHWVY
jgi:hypothetical protein